jgi:NAD+ synthase
MEINLPARIRMSTLHAIGQCVNGRVINTSNLSEDMVGYATQFGDNAGAYAPLQGLTVTEVKELGKYLIDVLGIEDEEYSAPALNRYVSIPNKKRLIELVDKTPVDGLQAQTDEERLGFTYADLDKFIRLDEGSYEFKEMIKKKYKQNKFKLEIVQMPQPDFSYLPNFVKD